MDTLRGIETFVRAVEVGSISGAAKMLGISPAAASQNLARLEAQLGTRLLVRTTRSLALTDTGEVYFDKVRFLVRELELASQAVSELEGEPQGRLRLACSAAFAREVIAGLLPGFCHRYPQISVELIATDRDVDHLKESVDVSIRVKSLLADGLVAVPLITVPTIFCAAPDYLNKEGVPTTPEELRDHDCLVFRLPLDGRILRWGFVRDGAHFDAQVRETYISDDIGSLLRMALAGAGITRLGAFIAKPYIDSGELVELFKQEGGCGAQAQIDPLEFYLCVSDRYQFTPKVRALSDYLREVLPEVLGLDPA